MPAAELGKSCVVVETQSSRAQRFVPAAVEHASMFRPQLAQGVAKIGRPYVRSKMEYCTRSKELKTCSPLYVGKQ